MIRYLYIYVDDIIVPSDTLEEGLEKLRELFERLRHANLTLNLKKCNFFLNCVTYLGFTISVKGREG